jgi:hypothetical protein
MNGTATPRRIDIRLQAAAIALSHRGGNWSLAAPLAVELIAFAEDAPPVAVLAAGRQPEPREVVLNLLAVLGPMSERWLLDSTGLAPAALKALLREQAAQGLVCRDEAWVAPVWRIVPAGSPVEGSAVEDSTGGGSYLEIVPREGADAGDPPPSSPPHFPLATLKAARKRPAPAVETPGADAPAPDIPDGEPPSRAEPDPAPVEAAAAPKPLDVRAAALKSLLRDLADRREVCPQGPALATQLGWASGASVKTALDRLIAGGHVSVRVERNIRIVRILDSGAETAPPAVVLPVAAPAKRLSHRPGPGQRPRGAAGDAALIEAAVAAGKATRVPMGAGETDIMLELRKAGHKVDRDNRGGTWRWLLDGKPRPFRAVLEIYNAIRRTQGRAPVPLSVAATKGKGNGHADAH